MRLGLLVPCACSTPIAIPSGSNPANNSDPQSFPGNPGCCIVLNNQGKVMATYSGNGINGPWGEDPLMQVLCIVCVLL